MGVVGVARRQARVRHRRSRACAGRRNGRSAPRTSASARSISASGLSLADRAARGGRIAARQPPVFERRRHAAQPAEAAVAGDRAFERQLHRDRLLDLPLRGQAAGLVVDHDQFAAAQPVDAVGDRGDRERTGAAPAAARCPCTRRAARRFRRGARAPRRRTSARCARSAATRRPTRRAATGSRPKHSRPIASSSSSGNSGRIARIALDEFAQRRDAPRCRDRRVRGPASSSSSAFSAQDVAGVDRVGIADPGLDLRHRQPARPGGERRARFGRRRRAAAWSADRAEPRRRRSRARGRARRRGRPRAAPCRAAAASATARSALPRAAPRGSARPTARRVACAKSCAAMPIARSGSAMPNSRRICRDIHGS